MLLWNKPTISGFFIDVVHTKHFRCHCFQLKYVVLVCRWIDAGGKKGKGEKKSKTEQKTSEISISVPTAESSMYYHTFVSCIWQNLSCFAIYDLSFNPCHDSCICCFWWQYCFTVYISMRHSWIVNLFLWSIVSKSWLCELVAAALPEGVLPLFLSSKTQELFGVHADIDVTVENPMKIVSKEQVLQDLYNRAAISDFHPVKPLMVVCMLEVLHAINVSETLCHKIVTRSRCFIL